MIHVLLCDDHLIVREGLKQVLAEDANVRVVAEASSAEEMLAQVLPLRERGQLDVVLLDIALPGGFEPFTDLIVREADQSSLVEIIDNLGIETVAADMNAVEIILPPHGVVTRFVVDCRLIINHIIEGAPIVNQRRQRRKGIV